MVDKEFEVEVIINLGQMTPDDVRVQLIFRPAQYPRQIGDEGGEATDMEL